MNHNSRWLIEHNQFIVLIQKTSHNHFFQVAARGGEPVIWFYRSEGWDPDFVAQIQLVGGPLPAAIDPDFTLTEHLVDTRSGNSFQFIE